MSKYIAAGGMPGHVRAMDPHVLLGCLRQGSQPSEANKGTQPEG